MKLWPFKRKPVIKAEPMLLTASIINREAIMLLRNELRRPTVGEGIVEPYPLKVGRTTGTYSVAIAAMSEDDRELSLEAFSESFIAPAMRRLAEIVRDMPLGDELMELPKGVAGAAADRFDGIAMRTIISDEWPIDKKSQGGWHRRIKYYDVATDSMRTGDCTKAIVFTVHEPGTVKIPTIDRRVSA